MVSYLSLDPIPILICRDYRGKPQNLSVWHDSWHKFELAISRVTSKRTYHSRDREVRRIVIGKVSESIRTLFVYICIFFGADCNGRAV